MKQIEFKIHNRLIMPKKKSNRIDMGEIMKKLSVTFIEQPNYDKSIIFNELWAYISIFLALLVSLTFLL